MSDTLSTPQIAKRFGVAEAKIRAWIQAGELRALNLATLPSGRPLYRVELADLLAFQERRAVAKPLPKVRQKPRRDVQVIEFF